MSHALFHISKHLIKDFLKAYVSSCLSDVSGLKHHPNISFSFFFPLSSPVKYVSLLLQFADSHVNTSRQISIISNPACFSFLVIRNQPNISSGQNTSFDLLIFQVSKCLGKDFFRTNRLCLSCISGFKTYCQRLLRTKQVDQA